MPSAAVRSKEFIFASKSLYSNDLRQTSAMFMNYPEESGMTSEQVEEVIHKTIDF